ncbi:MAG: hypothetical protein ACK4ZD_10565 [Caldimonas sp.]|uniref:hypothetical protein n=1 Tax=Caldimonas sp. TaxID=2838790 RepID=UPI00391DEB76
MSLSENERMAIAAHLHVLLRRKLGRVTDTEWMATNWEYAQEILRRCRAEGDAELQGWADKLEQAMQASRPKPVHAPKPWAHGPLPGDGAGPADAGGRGAVGLAQRYVGRLR